MDMSVFTFKLLLLFFPGLISAFLIDQLTVHRPREKFFFLIQSFVLGLSSYFLYWIILKVISKWVDSIDTSMISLRTLTNSNITFSFSEIIYVTICSIIIALTITVLAKYKVINRIARKCQLTNKFGELDVWGYFMNIKEIEWATVRDHPNDLIFDGWIQAFSDDSKHAEVLLRDVSVYKNSTGEKLYQVGSIYLSRNRQDISIECRTIEVDKDIKWKE